MNLEDCWVQLQGEDAQLMFLPPDSTLADVLDVLECNKPMQLQQKSGKFGQFSRNIALAVLRIQCSGDGRTAETAFQLQGPPSSMISSAILAAIRSNTKV